MKRSASRQILWTSLLAASFTINAYSTPLGRLSGSAAASNRIGIFNADAMLPITGDNNHILYTDINGGSDTEKTWITSASIGYRGIVNNVILGCYAFADYQELGTKGHFTVMNPGFEILSPHWDFHANGYITLDRKSKNGIRDFADNYGITDGELPVGNTLEDTPVTPVAIFGSGADSAIGFSWAYKRNLRARFSLGGYYYNVPDNILRASDVKGGTAQIGMAFNARLFIAVSDSYDNIFKNTASLKLTYSLGNENNGNLYSRHVQIRLLSPVERHIGIQTTAAGQDSQQGYTDVGPETVQLNNVFYFDPNLASPRGPGFSNVVGIGLGDCTASNPCGNSDLSQRNIDILDAGISGGATFYLGSGTFTPGNTLTFYAGQKVIGRSNNFTQNATGNDRPLITDGLVFDASGAGNTGSSTLENMRIQGNSPFTSGTTYQIGVHIASTADQDVSISNSDISSSSTLRRAVALYNFSSSSNVTVSSSTLTGATSVNNSLNANGIVNSGDANVTVTNSTVTAETNSFESSPEVLINSGAGTLTLSNSTLTADALAGASFLTFTAVTNSGSGSTIIENGSALTINSSDDFSEFTALKATAGSIAFNGSTLTLNDNSFNPQISSGTVTFSGSTCIRNSSVIPCS